LEGYHVARAESEPIMGYLYSLQRGEGLEAKPPEADVRQLIGLE